MKDNFENNYPKITDWVENRGWIEIGQDDYSRSFVRALDIGGTVWEGKTKYQTLDDALRDMEKGIGDWVKEVG